MGIADINRVIDGAEELNLKEKAIIKKTYPAVREQIKKNNPAVSELNLLTSFIAFTRINLGVGA